MSFHPLEIDEPAFHVDRRQLHAYFRADVHAFESPNDPSFDGKCEKSGPRALGRRARDERIELFAQPRLKKQRRGGLADLRQSD